MAINFNRVEFVLSAASEKQFVRDGMPQLAFAGRSNVGKSSVINRIVNRKNFARRFHKKRLRDQKIEYQLDKTCFGPSGSL